MNQEAELQSRSVMPLKMSSKVDTHHSIFLLQEFRIKYQHSDLGSRSIQCRKGCFSGSMDKSRGLHFPTFFSDNKDIKKVQVEQATLLLITPVWQTQPWYPKILKMSIIHRILIPN